MMENHIKLVPNEWPLIPAAIRTGDTALSADYGDSDDGKLLAFKRAVW